MKTRIIPAQITTVEDMIAGNLNFAQINLLILPILLSGANYVLIPVAMKLSVIKLSISFITFLVCLILAIKIKGKIILQWVLILVRFNMRSKYYVFDKNARAMREIDLPSFEKKSFKLFSKKQSKNKTKVTVSYPKFDIQEMVKLEQIIQKGQISFKSIKKVGGGGKFNVAFEQNRK